MIVEKKFLSVDEQIELLVSQGLIITDNYSARLILSNHSYYSIVNGYCDLLLDKRSPKMYKKGATFKELVAIHDFDSSFRRFLFPQILYIEDKIKANCINAFCGEKDSAGNLVHTGEDYLRESSYETINPIKRAAVSHLISELGKPVAANVARNEAFKHAIACYGYVPFWVLATNLSFGQISRFYECLNVNDRNLVAEIYGVTEYEMRTILKIVNMIRNCCAHNGRVYCIHIPFYLPKTLGTLKVCMSTIDASCQNKFGSILYCLKYLLSKSKFSKIIIELSKELTSLSRELSIIKIQQILKKMGISAQMVKEFGIKIMP